MKNLEINKNVVKKLGMAALITSSLMLGGCGSSNTEKSKDEPTVDVEKDNGIPFEKMTEEEMNLLAEGDSVTKLPDSEYLNKLELDFLYVYNTWTKPTDGEFPVEPILYFTKDYRKDGDDVASDYIQKFELKEIFIGSIYYGKITATGKWVKNIKTPADTWFIVENIPQEKIDELEKGEAQFTK